MERAEAERLRARMAAEHPDRSTHSFLLSERDGEWEVAKICLPPGPVDARPGVPASRQASHGHDSSRLPGGVPNTTAGL